MLTRVEWCRWDAGRRVGCKLCTAVELLGSRCLMCAVISSSLLRHCLAYVHCCQQLVVSNSRTVTDSQDATSEAVCGGAVNLQVGDVLSKCSAVVLKAGKVSNSARLTIQWLYKPSY